MRIETLDVALPDYVEYDTVEPVFATTGGGSLECRFFLELTKDGDVSYAEFNNLAYVYPEEHINFSYAGVLSAVDQKYMHDAYPDVFEEPATIVNVTVTVHVGGGAEIIFDEESLENGLFTRFTLKTAAGNVDFTGKQLNYNDADIYVDDLTGDGVNDYAVVFKNGKGTSFLSKEVHVFSGATLLEITVPSPMDYLDENLTQSSSGDAYTLEVGGSEYVIEKSRLVTPSAQSADRVSTGSHLTYRVNEDGELIAVVGCMVGMGEYVGVIEIVYEYTDSGEPLVASAVYVDVLSLEYGLNSYYDSVR